MNTIAMYSTNLNGSSVRVIVFSGILQGKMAAYENTKNWDDAFELARMLNIEIKPAYGYAGRLTQR